MIFRYAIVFFVLFKDELTLAAIIGLNRTNSVNSLSSTPLPCSLYQGPIPDRFDWRLKSKVGTIKDQRKCEACWAFSITATIESHIMIYGTGNGDLDLSEQMLIDCLRDSPGCRSSSLLQSYANIVSTLGYMVLEDEYPYTGGQTKCQDKQYSRTFAVSGFQRISQNEEEMKRHLVMCGPLTAAINAESMKAYKGGYIDEPTEEQCSSSTKSLDHSIEIVGYDYYRDNTTDDKSKQYWIIKNSWSEQWGDQGFYYLVLGRNACGVSSDVSLPIVV